MQDVKNSDLLVLSMRWRIGGIEDSIMHIHVEQRHCSFAFLLTTEVLNSTDRTAILIVLVSYPDPNDNIGPADHVILMFY